MSIQGVYAGILEAECREELKEATTVEDKLRVAFRKAREHWMITNDSDQFNSAVAAAYLHATVDDKVRLEHSMNAVKALNAMLSGVPIDLAALAEQAQEASNIPLISLWHDAKKQS